MRLARGVPEDGLVIDDLRPVAHARSATEVAGALRSDAAAGLSTGRSRGASRRLRPERARTPDASRRTSRSPCTSWPTRSSRLLVAAAVVSFAVGEGLESAVIAAIVILNAAFGFVQEVRAARAVMALTQAVEITARSSSRRRAARACRPASSCPGDLVRVREGDRVPADARVVSAIGLEVDESALTGESVPVAKGADAVAVEAPLAERESMLFAGTGVTRGAGLALLVATGAADRAGAHRRADRPGGSSADAARAALRPAGLQARRRRARHHGRARRSDVSAGRERPRVLPRRGLGRGGRRARGAGGDGHDRPRARRPRDGGARSRRRTLSAIEAVGEATVVCADKTGTLTENRLKLERLEPASWVTRDEVLRAAYAVRRSGDRPGRPGARHRGPGRGGTDSGSHRPQHPVRGLAEAGDGARLRGRSAVVGREGRSGGRAAARRRCRRRARAARTPRRGVGGRRPASPRPRRPRDRERRESRTSRTAPSRSASSLSPTRCGPRRRRPSWLPATRASRSACSPATTRVPRTRSAGNSASPTTRSSPGAHPPRSSRSSSSSSMTARSSSSRATG